MTPVDAAARLRDRFGVETTADGPVLHVPLGREQWQDAARFAREALACGFFNWLTAVDWKEQGLEVVCRLDDLEGGLGLMLRLRLAPGEVHCPSLTGIYRGADWMERECYDMFGIVFDGHPDLRRILLGDDWVGYPLRKDYALDTPHAPYR